MQSDEKKELRKEADIIYAIVLQVQEFVRSSKIYISGGADRLVRKQCKKLYGLDFSQINALLDDAKYFDGLAKAELAFNIFMDDYYVQQYSIIIWSIYATYCTMKFGIDVCQHESVPQMTV